MTDVLDAMDGDGAVETAQISLISIPEPLPGDDDPTFTRINNSAASDTPPADTPLSSVDVPSNDDDGSMQTVLATAASLVGNGLVAASDDMSKDQMDARATTSTLNPAALLDVNMQAELMDHQPSNGDISDASVAATAEEGQEWQLEAENEMKRVKVRPGRPQYPLSHAQPGVPTHWGSLARPRNCILFWTFLTGRLRSAAHRAVRTQLPGHRFDYDNTVQRRLPTPARFVVGKLKHII